MPLLASGQNSELPAQLNDLAFLHRIVRQRNPRCILEFGCGFSTIVMAHALADGVLHSIDTSLEWIDNTRSKIGNKHSVFFHHSPVQVGTFNGRLCHYYNNLPNVVPDFIYLDGPDPAAVIGSINGLSFENPDRTVMAADVLLMESTLLPGFFMVVDGRTNNARFLSRNLQRKYKVRWMRSADITTFEMLEPKLGYRNIFGYER